jgi:hypothetical protein
MSGGRFRRRELIAMAAEDADHRTLYCNDPDPLRHKPFKFTVLLLI